MRRRWFIATTALAAMALTALTTPPASARPAGTAQLHWRDCHTDNTAKDLQCATLRVPLDWAHPHGPTISLAIDRLPATDPAHRIGPLLVNPGGPGGSATAVVAQGGMLLGAPELATVRQRFDLVGVDPRGVGDSTPVRCAKPVYDPSVPAFPRTEAQYRSMLTSSHTHGRDCAAHTGPLLGHVDTVSVARDLNAVRVALGAPTISFLGVSYGTELGSIFAQRYPDRVRAMVLDGAVDHGRSLARDAVDESRAIEDEFGRFARWCAGTSDCALHGTDVLGDFDALTARADRGEIVDGQLGRPVTGAELTGGAYGYLTLRSMWPQLATALAAAETNPSDPTGLDAAAPANDPTYPAYRAVACQDFPPRLHGLGDQRARESHIRTVAPHTWRYSEMWDMTLGCSGWPVPAANPPHRQHITGAPPILVVGNTHDPATPYRWARSLAGQIDGSRLLTYDGDGHTALENSSCARTREAAYLVTGRAPAPGTVCRA